MNGEEPSAAGCVAGARAAPQLAGLQRASAWVGVVGLRLFLSPSAKLGNTGLSARVVAVGVVVGAGLPERAQRAGQVGRVGTEEGGDRDRFLHDCTAAGDAVVSCLYSSGSTRAMSVRSLFGPGRLNTLLNSLIVGVPSSPASFRLVEQRDQRLAWSVSRRRPAFSSALKRRGQLGERLVALLQRDRQLFQARRRTSPAGRRSRRTSCSRFRSGPRAAALARADRRHGLGRFDQELREQRLVAHQLGEEVVGGRRGRARSIRSFRRAACRRRRTVRPLPWMNSCRPFRVFGSSVLNSWSRSVTSFGRAGRQPRARHPARGALFGPGRSARCSGWRRSTATACAPERVSPRAVARASTFTWIVTSPCIRSSARCS